MVYKQILAPESYALAVTGHKTSGRKTGLKASKETTIMQKDIYGRHGKTEMDLLELVE